MKHYTQEELEYLEAHAKNMHRALNNGDYRTVSNGVRHLIRDELNRTVKHLYSYNINLTDLLA